MIPTSNSKGALQVVLLLAVFVMTTAGFGIWSLMRHWRFLVQTQLRLDQCIGKAARDYRDTLNSLNSDNLRIHALRASIAAAHLKPELLPALRLALKGVETHQNWIQVQWQLRRGKWMVQKGCGGQKDFALPLPELQFIRPTEDMIGALPLQWEGEAPDHFDFEVACRPRYAAARVEGGCIDSNLGCQEWKANWSAPRFIRAVGR